MDITVEHVGGGTAEPRARLATEVATLVGTYVLSLEDGEWKVVGQTGFGLSSEAADTPLN